MSSTIENIRPNRPNRRLEESVADRIEALLARCEGVRRGSDLPVLFDARGEAAAQAIAAADKAKNQSQRFSGEVPTH
jgi:hypothetical protein